MSTSETTPVKTKKSNEMNFNALLDAIRDNLLKKKSIRLAAREYGVDRMTLTRHVKKVVDHFTDISTVKDVDLLEFIRTSNTHIPSNMVFSPSQERVLVEYILKCVNHYYGLSINELMELAYQFAVKLKIDYPESWNEHSKAGRMWYRGFMKRHNNLTLRTPEQTSMNRIKAFCKTNVESFFSNFGQLLDKHQYDSASIYNMDESGFSTVPTNIGKVIAMKGMRRVGQLEAAERGTMVTMALTVSASGNSIPPFFLFPRKKMQACFMDNAASGAVGYANSSGWMCQEEFVRFIKHFIKFVKPTVASPVLLLLDNHTSHLSVDALDLAAANGIHILSFPPHCSHKLQPLDVSVFGPIKNHYKSQCSAWQKNNANKVLEIRHVAGIVCKTLDLALTPKTIKSGFSATGIQPFNPDIFTDADFVQAVEVNAREVEVDAGLDEDEQRRIICNPLKVGREENVDGTPSTSRDSSTSRSVSVSSHSTNVMSLLDEIGPLQGATTRAKSKRGRKAMESCELTSPDTINLLKDKKQQKMSKSPGKAAKKKAQPPANRPKKKKSTPSELLDKDIDFCTICLRFLPKELTPNNSIKCNSCGRPFHLKCANMTRSYFTCKNCDTDDE